MDQAKRTALKQIHQAVVQEFLARGFRGASLRQIVRNASATTGAFYGYFSGKEVASIVEPHAAAVTRRSLALWNCRSQSRCMWGWSPRPLACMCQHFDVLKLLTCCAEGTSYENFIQNMAEAAIRFMAGPMETGA